MRNLFWLPFDCCDKFDKR